MPEVKRLKPGPNPVPHQVVLTKKDPELPIVHDMKFVIYMGEDQPEAFKKAFKKLLHPDTNIEVYPLPPSNPEEVH